MRPIPPSRNPTKAKSPSPAGSRKKIHPLEIPFQLGMIFMKFMETPKFFYSKAHSSIKVGERVMLVSFFPFLEPIVHLHKTQCPSSFSIKPMPCPSALGSVVLVYHQEKTPVFCDASLERKTLGPRTS